MITPDVIEEVKNRLIKVYDPMAIYIFGSYAWGHPDDESDLDLLVVIDESDERSHRRTIAGYKALAGMGISKDLMVYTKSEFDERIGDLTTLVHKVIKDGKILYARA